ncbi:MAG: AAA family ATPase [Candidatus Eisenbacteria bacterium]
MDNLRVVIIDSDELTRKGIRSHLEALTGVEIAGETDDPTTGHRLIRQKAPHVMLIEVSSIEDPMMELVHDVHEEMPDVQILATSAHKNPDLILKAMSSGAKEFLLRPIDFVKVQESVQKVLRDSLRQRESGETNGRVISFFSNKGGVGATTLATNVAAGLAKGGRRVVLVDFDLQLGNAASFLDLTPQYTMYDLVKQIDKVTRRTVDGFLTRHSSGVAVLAEPRTPAEAESVTAHHVSRILAFLKSAFDYIVVDTPHSFDERTLEVLDGSDEIYVTSEMSLPALRNLRKCLDVFRDLEYDRARIRVVVNRYDPKGMIRLDDVQESFNFEAFATIPNDFRRVMEGINVGTPLVVGAPESETGREILRLCRRIAGEDPAGDGSGEKSGRPGALGRLFGKRRED